jgi:hypothetical protein
MNLEVKARWALALRSGDFAQGDVYLCKVLPDGSRKHCCLGVLCEIHGETRVTSVQWDDRASLQTYDGRVSSLPEVVSRWAQLSYNDEADLIDMNDKQGKSFGEIANYIEEKL